MNSRDLFEKGQLIVQIDPAVAGFGQDDAALAGVDVGKQQIQPSLIAALALNRQRLAVRAASSPAPDKCPGSAPRSIHVTAPVLMSTTPSRIEHVGSAGRGIALREGRDIVGGDLEALGQLDRSFIDAREGDMSVVRRPPVAGAAVHLFLGDELRHAVLDRRRRRRWSAPFPCLAAMS